MFYFQNRAADKKKTNDNFEGNGTATMAPDPNGLDNIVKKAKEGSAKAEERGEKEESKSDVRITLWQNGF